MKNQPIYIQYLLEIALILVLSYGASLYLPWWIIAIVAAIVSFLFNAKTFSFITGFVAIALLWGSMAFLLSAGNDHILATKMAGILNPDGAIGAIGVVVVTALIGGFVGGMGAWTGQLGRRMFSEN